MHSELLPADKEQLLTAVRGERTRRACSRSFHAFLPFWHFVDRETGALRSFGPCQRPEHDHAGELWPGQRQFADTMVAHPWLFALKAGKLGFTELECAWDAWVALFRQVNARVHVFSLDAKEAQELMRYITFGLEHLPGSLRPRLLGEEAGGKTSSSLRWRGGPDDVRSVVSFSADKDVSIAQTCQHAHVDELARMPFPRDTWSAINTTIAPSGSCHVVTRGAGEKNFSAVLWKSAVAGTSKLYPLFVPWSERPGRDASWYAAEQGSMHTQAFRHAYPEKPEDALAGDETLGYVPIELWDRCRDEGLPPYVPGDETFAVVGVDAGFRSDCFAVVIVTRHPERHDDIAVRGIRLWIPEPSREVELAEPEDFIRALAFGGCAAGHYVPDVRLTADRQPYLDAHPECPACNPPDGSPAHLVKPIALYEVAYDPRLLEGTAQRLRKEGINFQEFGQQKDRLIADSELRDLIVNRRIAHSGNALMRQHVQNAAAKLDSEERKLRIVKRSPEAKVDLLVALSMAAHRCMRLYL